MPLQSANRDADQNSQPVYLTCYRGCLNGAANGIELSSLGSRSSLYRRLTKSQQQNETSAGRVHHKTSAASGEHDTVTLNADPWRNSQAHSWWRPIWPSPRTPRSRTLFGRSCEIQPAPPNSGKKYASNASPSPSSPRQYRRGTGC